MKNQDKRQVAEFLKQEIRIRAEDKYILSEEPEIANRIREEWEAVLRVDGLADLAAVYELTQNLRKQGQVYSMRGTAGDSFLLYLLGITLTNPLPAHLYCPHCRKVIWEPGYQDGWDILPENCPCCNHAMQPEGHNIPWQMHWGFGIHPVAYTIEVDYRLRDQVKNWADHHWLRKLEPELIPVQVLTTENHLAYVKIHDIYVGCTMDYSKVSHHFWENPALPAPKESERGRQIKEQCQDMLNRFPKGHAMECMLFQMKAYG